MNKNIMQILINSVQEYNILPLTSICNVSCEFCSHKQNPSELNTVFLKPLALEIVENLLDFIDANRKIVIGESISMIMEGEPFTYPDFFKVLFQIRERYPDTLIQITTNGTYLNEDNIKKLKRLEPLQIYFSLNAVEKENRIKLMKDKNPQIACEAGNLLQKYAIEYHGSIVAMPHITGWDSLFKTLNYLSKNGAKTIRVFKPGYTRFGTSLLSAIEELEEKIQKWREGLCPITIEPLELSNLVVNIEGIINKSPLAQAGIKQGDIIKSINKEIPFSRVEAFHILEKNGIHELEIERQGYCFKTSIEIKEGTSGLVVNYDISLKEVQRIEKAIKDFGADKVLLMASQLGYKILQTALGHITNLEIVAVRNYFFGGNIKCAGLLVVEDLKRAYLQYTKNSAIPDLILIPAAIFNYHDEDLTGVSFYEFEQKIEAPVVML